MLYRQTLLYLPAQLVGPVMQFIAAVVWTHLMDAPTYGVVTFLIAAQELAFLFALSWWSAYMLRFRAELEAREGLDLAGQDYFFVLVATLVQIAATLPILMLVHVPLTLPLLAATAWFFTTRSAIGHYSEIARSQTAIGTYSIGLLASPVSGTLLSFAVLMRFGPDPAWVFGSMALAQTLALAAMMIRLGVITRPRRPDRALLKSALIYCGPLIASGLPFWFITNGIRLVVEMMSGAAALGLVSVGWGLGQRIAAVAAMPVTAAAFPIAVDRLAAGDKEGALRQVALNGTLIFGILAPMMVGAWVIARPLVELVIAEPFREMTILIFPVAAASGALRNLNMHGVAQVFLLLVRTDLVLILNVVEALLTIALCIGGLWLGGLAGAALGCLLAAALGLAIAMGLAQRHGLPIPAVMMAKIVLAAAVMGGGLKLIVWPEGVLGLAMTIAAGGTIYAAMLIGLFPDIRSVLATRLRRA